MIEIPADIFKAYDIRGVYPTEINEKNIEIIGKALGTVLSQKNLKTAVVGRDDRESSASLTNSLINGLLSTGINVISTGITVQPATHFFTFLDGVDAAMNVTASHNPGEFNGLKIDFKNAMPCHGEELTSLRQIALAGKFKSGKGTYKEENLNQKYIDFVSSKFKLKNRSQKIKVVIYCGNGATSEIYPAVLEKIGVEVIPLRCYLDSSFPAGVPDPEMGNFFPELKDQILESGADIGVGFDGDGDRVGEMDENGVGYKADEILLLFIKDVLTKTPGAKIIFDIKSSQVVGEYVKKLGGVPTMLKTGRAFFLEKLFNNEAVLGGELSGHIYFKDDYLGYDDGIYAACRILKIMDESGKKLSELMSEFPKMVSTPEFKIDSTDKEKFKIVAEVVDEIKKSKGFLEINEIDGARVSVSSTGWFLIRASNTTPQISLRVEGRDQEEVERILKTLTGLLAKHSVILNI